MCPACPVHCGNGTKGNQSRGSKVSFRTEAYEYKDAQPYALCSADFNGDGKKDLAIALWGPNAVALLLGK